MVEYFLKPRNFFLSQINELTDSEKKLISEKLELVKINPFRYKGLSVPGLTKVFEIKITLSGLYSRLIYTVKGNEVRVECIINRNNDFKDLVKLLYKARQD
ncbi:MAG: hypothetical protein V1722_02700 [Candidatus Micrarchaeota archaeon]